MEDQEGGAYPVQINLYHVSGGRCALQIWQVGLVAYGRELHFTKKGITTFLPEGTPLGPPSRVENVGETQLPYSVFLDYALSLADAKYRPDKWRPDSQISNQFVDDCCQFLCGVGIPKFLLDSISDLQNEAGRELALGQLQNLGDGGMSLADNHGLIRLMRQEDDEELEELNNQIEALRASQNSLSDRRRILLEADEQKKRSRKRGAKSGTKEKKTPGRRRESGDGGESLATGSWEAEEEEEKAGGAEQPVIAREKAVSQEASCSSNSSCAAADQPHSILRRSSCQLPLESPTCSPRAQGVLYRNKSLKRVSFDDRAELILSCRAIRAAPTQSEDPQQDSPEGEEDLPPLEEVTPQSDQNSLSGRPSRHRPPTPPIGSMAGVQDQLDIVGEEGGEQIPKKEKKPHIKGITYRDFDHIKEFEDLVRTVVTLCDQDEQERLREMEDWIVKNEGTWVLAEGFNSFLGRVFDDRWPSEGRVAMLRLLAYGAGQDDIVLILHMDRRDHLLMNYANRFDRLPVKEQESLALLFANLFETGSSSEWLLYISEWDAPGGGLPLSNIRVTTKVAVNALLGDTPTLVEYGSALMSNLATKEVFDDVCSELAMAILQFFQGKPPEEQVYRCMKALHKFITIGGRDVPQLVKMIGPDPAKFSGLSPRVDEALAPISARLASIPGF